MSLMEAGGARRAARILAALAVCAAAALVGAADVVAPRRLASGALAIGYFEAEDEGPVLTLVDQPDDPILLYGLRADGKRAEVMLGKTVATVLEEGETYRVDTSADAPAPFCVIGRLVDHPPAAIDANAVPARLSDGAVFAAIGGAIRLEPWQVGAPWPADDRRLRALAAACDPARTAPMLLAVVAGTLQVDYGSCQSRLPLPPGPGRPVLAVVAGPNWASIARAEAGWETVRGLAPAPIAVAVATAALALAAFGTLPTLGLSAMVMLAGCASGIMAAALWVLVGAAALIVVLVREMRRAMRPGSRRWVIAGVAVALLATGALAIARRDRHAPPTAAPCPAGCLLTGYSTVEGLGLRRSSSRALLEEACPACRGASDVRGFKGMNFRRIAQLVCDDCSAIDAATRIAFVGGSNDDVFWDQRFGWSRLRDVVLMLRVLWQVDRQRELQPAFGRVLRYGERQSLAAIAAQREAVARALECIERRRFVYLQDMMVQDLARPRSPARQRLLAARRELVEAAGGRFLDARTVFAADAGVSWFNDFIHLSEIGHRRVAAALCAAWEADPEASGSAAGGPPAS